MSGGASSFASSAGMPELDDSTTAEEPKCLLMSLSYSEEDYPAEVGIIENELSQNRETSVHGGLASTSQSVKSFPVKRSGLANRHLPVPGAFETVDATLNKLSHETVKRAATIPSTPDSQDADQTNADSLSPKKKRNKRESEHRTPVSVVVDVKPLESPAHLKDIPDSASHADQVKPVHDSAPSVDEIIKETAKSTHSATAGSSSLVSYNSSGDELPEGDQVSAKDKHQRKHRRKSTSHIYRSKKSANEASDQLKEHLNCGPSDQSVNTRDVKVIKCTSKSTWDSSDSDFDSTIASGNEKMLNTDSQPSSKSPNRDNQPTKIKSKKQKSEHLEARTGKSRSDERRTSSPEAKPSKSSDEVQPVSRSRHDTRQSLERNRKDNSPDHRHLKAQNYKRRSNSSARSPEDPPGGGNNRNKSRDRHRNRWSRSRSRKSHSSRWSTTDSRESSYRSRRHRRHRRRRSNSYSSRSSFRHSSTSTRSHYRGRSGSSISSHSDGGRRRYHSRSSHCRRRRYGRHSYSSRSATRSRSRHFSDSSSRYSSKSSHTSISSRASSHNSVHRRTIAGYSRQSREGTSQRHQKPTGDSVTTQDNLAAGGVSEKLGSFVATSESKADTPSSSSYRFTSSSVADAVSAAVRRVTGARTPTNKTNPKTSSAPSEAGLSKPPSGKKHQGSHGGNGTLFSTSSVVVDIPLPKEEDPPYIGPQLSPDLAERFGLPLARTGSVGTIDGNKGVVQPQEITVSSGCHPAVEGACTDQSSDTLSQEGENRPSTLEFTIPPEKAEQYRALQEQAKQHALRRNNFLTNVNADSDVAQQQFHAGALLHGESFVPAVSLMPVNSMGYTYGLPTLVPSCSVSSVDQWSNQIASAIQARQFVSAPNLFWTNQQLVDAQQQQQILNSVNCLNGVSPLMTSRPLSTDQSPTVLPKPLHQPDSTNVVALNQLQQLQMATAIHSNGIPAQLMQAATVGAQAMVSNPYNAALANKLLQHLAALNQQKASTSQTGQLTSNQLAQYQQLQLLAQLPKQMADPSRFPVFVSNPGEGTVLHGVEQAQLGPVPGISSALSTLLQQQQILAALQQPRQALTPSATMQSPMASAMAALVNAAGAQHKPTFQQQHPSSTEFMTNPVATSVRLFPPNVAAFQAQQLQQLQALQAIVAAQQKQQRLLGTAQDQALLVALAAAQRRQQQQQQLIQTQLLQQQQQQQQQQALAASAILAAQLQQRQQPPQQ